jgi:hypothetical protein
MPGRILAKYPTSRRIKSVSVAAEPTRAKFEFIQSKKLFFILEKKTIRGE